MVSNKYAGDRPPKQSSKTSQSVPRERLSAKSKAFNSLAISRANEDDSELPIEYFEYESRLDVVSQKIVRSKILAALNKRPGIRLDNNRPSLYFDPVEVLDPEHRVLPVIRVSTYGQKGNISGQEENVIQALDCIGVSIVRTNHRRIWSAKPNRDDWNIVMRDVVLAALELKADCIFFESVSRAIRHPRFDKKHQDAVPGYSEFSKLMNLLDEVDPEQRLRLVTLDPPDSKDRGMQSSRGQKASGNKGGRGNKKSEKECDVEKTTTKPWVKDRQRRWQPVVYELIDQGCSWQEAADRVNGAMDQENECNDCRWEHINRSTVGDWLRARNLRRR